LGGRGKGRNQLYHIVRACLKKKGTGLKLWRTLPFFLSSLKTNVLFLLPAPFERRKEPFPAHFL
jgi:hypothetical protein